MENIAAYLPEIDDETLEPFFKAIGNATLETAANSFIDSIAADIDGATADQIAEDKINFKAFILSEYACCWEDREPHINERGETVSAGY